MSDVSLLVGGLRFVGWESVRVVRSIESLAGSFALGVSDRFGDELWPVTAIAEEDACRVAIGDTTVIDGFVDKRQVQASATARTLSYSGRDRAAALVDNSVVLDKWTYYNVNVADFARAIAEPFEIKVTVQSGLVLAKVPKVVVSPGDTAFEALMHAVGDQGVLVVSDGAGGIVLTRAGTVRAPALVEKQNILAATVDYDGTNRYHRYVLATQRAGTDDAAGDATRVRAEAIDEGVRRTSRVLLIRPEKGYSVADARKRADWEARIRAARAETVTIVVQGWEMPDGKLWPLNALTRVHAPRLIGVDGDMRISQAEHTISNSGKVTQLRLVRPDAFTPEPKATVRSSVKSNGFGWKELAKGAL